jgi:hypothetical protein
MCTSCCLSLFGVDSLCRISLTMTCIAYVSRFPLLQACWWWPL